MGTKTVETIEKEIDRLYVQMARCRDEISDIDSIMESRGEAGWPTPNSTEAEKEIEDLLSQISLLRKEQALLGA